MLGVGLLGRMVGRAAGRVLRWGRMVVGLFFAGEGEAAAAPTAGPAVLDADRQVKARAYARQRQRLTLINLGLSAVAVVGVLASGIGFRLRDALAAVPWLPAWEPVVGFRPALVGGFFLTLFAAVYLLDLPLSIYGGHILPRRYGVSTQRFGGWAFDQFKGLVLSLVFELGAVLVLYLLLALTPTAWWAWAGAGALVVTVGLANLAPILLLPLFYKLTPLPEGEVRTRVLDMAAKARTRVRGVYTLHLSDKTTAANAAVMGLGNTRRIVLSDTLLDRYTPDEIEVVIAHELGHQVHGDIGKLIAVQVVTTLGGLYLVNLVLHGVLGVVPDYRGLADPATMPLVGATLGVFGLVTLPLVNGFSRLVERRADQYALETTRDQSAFISAMTRLANQNLAELEPSPLVEFLLYNHPSIGRRLAHARAFAAQG